MIDAAALLGELRARGVSTVTGVPCSFLTPLINRVASDARVRYVRATQEGEAVAIAAGSWLAGAQACVIGQNSGLGNMVNPLSSLVHPCRMPIPLIVTWRGQPGCPDEPQHALMGRITPELLDLLRVGRSLLPATAEALSRAFDAAWAEMDRRQQPHAFVLPEGTVAAERLDEGEAEPLAPPRVVRHVPHAGSRPRRMAALERLLATVGEDCAIVATTGKTSRELFTLADRPQHFYLVGAMGSASAVGLGVALHTARPVVVVDGDGAALMRLGTLATVAAHPHARLVHVVLDNGVHDSTGGQRTLSDHVDFPAIAAASGYREVHACADLDGLASAVTAGLAAGGPAFVHLRIAPGSATGLGRPTVPPHEVARRFRDFVASEARAGGGVTGALLPAR